jgi:hypothetical protein
MITQLIDVSGITADYVSPQIPTKISGSRATIYVMNMSNVTYYLDFKDGNIAHVPAWWARPFCVPSSVKWMELSVAAFPVGMPNPPFSHVAIETYLLNEDTSKLQDTSITAQVSVQGNTSVTTTISNEVSQIGFAPGTTVIEVKPSDALSDTYFGDNEGNLTINGNNAGTLTTLLQLIAGASPGVKLAAAAVLTEVLGPLQVDSDAFIEGNLLLNNGKSIQGFDNTGTIRSLLTPSNTNKTLLGSMGSDIEFRDKLGNLLWSFNVSNGVLLCNAATVHIQNTTGNDIVSGGVNTHLNSPSGGTTLQVGGVDILGVVSNGINCNQLLNLSGSGSWRAVSTFTGTTISGTSAFNHGLGTTPDAVWVWYNGVGSATFGTSSYTSTQVSVTAAGSFPFRGVAIKIT